MKRLLLLPLLFLIAGCAFAGAARAGDLDGRRVLIFSHSTGYRHDSIDAAVPALSSLVAQAGGQAVASEDPDMFSTEQLARIDAIILVSTTTDPRRPESEWLVGSRREALKAFMARGGGIVAVHAASDSHYHWPWYGNLIGGRFERHPPGTPNGRLRVVDSDHPATAPLPPAFEHDDEWYFFRDYDPSSRLLLALDPTSIGEPEGSDAPISWSREVDGGRVFYTALGHTAETYSQPFFRQHVLGGLVWALGAEPR